MNFLSLQDGLLEHLALEQTICLTHLQFTLSLNVVRLPADLLNVVVSYYVRQRPHCAQT